MSNARKLQTEIDRVTKKVDEGVELFDEIWEKVYSAESQNQKEKHEIDLKKEIKKLQRLRDQIKTWIGSSDVKDKDSLVDYRKLIETKMEQFKVCEKETKTKTYSKEGLARAEKLSPEEQAKLDTCKWVGETIEKLQQLVEDRDVEIERLSTGKGKKTNKHVIEEYNEIITSHKFHINKLEGIMRLVMNDRLKAELVDDMKDDIDYYVEAHEEEEYMQCYDEEMFYDDLRLDDLGVVDVDRVTQAATVTKVSKSDDASATSGGHKEKKAKKTSSNVIPLTIGRARVSSGGKNKDDGKDTTTPTKKSSNSNSAVLGPTPTAPTARPPPPVNSNGGASMAAILKREGEQQEKERQKQAALQQAQQQRLLQEQQARAQAEQLRQQQMQRQQEQLRQQEVLRQQQQQQAAAQQKSQQEALQRQQQQQQQLQEQQRQQQEVAAAKQQQQVQLQVQQSTQQQQRPQQQQQTPSGNAGSQGGPIDSLLTGLGGLSLGSTTGGADTNVNGSPSATVSPKQQQQGSSMGTVGTPTSSGSYDATASYLGALDESYLHCPSNADSERQRTYTPRNPYPTPSSYPTTPSAIFENPAVFEKLGTDCLFFIFYYAQGTYQQYLTARELKKRSWRYHKKYMTWFQRHEEPKVTTDEYEQGTYVYFDYETGWCQRIKSDFRFEYCFLEDSLSI